MAFIVDEERHFVRTVKMKIVHMDWLITRVLVVSWDESQGHESPSSEMNRLTATASIAWLESQFHCEICSWLLHAFSKSPEPLQASSPTL